MRKKWKAILLFCALSQIVWWAALVSGWTYTYDTDTPLGSDSPAIIDDRIREVKDALQERLNVDHYFALTGSEVSDAAVGQHRQIEFYEPLTTPTHATNKGWLYTKDASSVVELHWLDESGNELQITSGGALYSSGNLSVAGNTTLTGTLDVTGNIDPTTYETTNGGFLDEDDMASDAANKVASQQSIKAYVDSKTQYDGTEIYNGTSPTGYTDLDIATLASITAQRMIVFLKVKNSSGDDIRYGFRTNGDTENIGSTQYTPEDAGTLGCDLADGYIGQVTVMTDTSGVVEWNTCQGTAGTTVIDLLGYLVLN